MKISPKVKSLSLRWPLRLKQISGNDNSIVVGALWVAGFLLVAKAISLMKEMAVAFRYGTSVVVDGYLFVFNLAQWPVSVFASVTAIIIIPYYVGVQKKDPFEARKLHYAFLELAALVGLAVSVFYGLFMWWFLSSNGSGLSAQGKSAALTSLPYVSAGIIFAFVSVIFSNWLMSRRRHFNTLFDATPAAVILIFLLFWPIERGENSVILPLITGTLLGFVLQALLLARWSQQKFSFVNLDVIGKHWSKLRGAFGIMLLAQVIFTSVSMIDQFFAVRMGEGVLASYSYAQRIMAVALGFMSIVIGRAILPVLSSLDDADMSFNLATKWAWFLSLLGSLGSLFLLIVSEWIVALLFQRGAFTENDTRQVAQILSILGLQLPFYIFSIVWVQWLGAVGRSSLLLLGAIVGFVTKLFVLFFWFDGGAIVLAFSTVAMYAVVSITSLVSVKYAQRTQFLKSIKGR